MHFICSTFGSAGDVFPLLGLALELRQRGHQITFLTNAHFENIVRQYDLHFERLGSEDDYQACINNPHLWQPRKALPHVLRSLLPGLRRQYEIHADLASAGNVVALTNCFGFGALLAQEKFGMPVITVHLQPAALWSDREPPALPGLFGPRWLQGLMYRMAGRFLVDPIVCPFLNPWRRELGLPPLKGVMQWWNSPYGILCLFPEWFAPPQVDWPAGIMQTDFPLWNHQTDAPLAANVETFLQSGEPPIVFTPGTANLHGRDFFRAAVEACRRLQRRGLLLTPFTEQLPSSLPDSVAHYPYVPLDRLLPRAAAFVHHGGVGSTSQAMLAGIPQVLMPLAHDQFDNAARVKRLGIGEAIPAPRFTSTRLTAALKGLFNSATVPDACRTVAQRLATRDGLSRSADAIERRIAKRSR